MSDEETDETCGGTYVQPVNSTEIKITPCNSVYKRKPDPFILKFIREFKKHDCIWNIRHKEYHNKYFVRRAWADLSVAMDTEASILRSKWKNLKDMYRKEVKKIVDNEYQGTWQYFDKFDFLRDTIEPTDKNDTEKSDFLQDSVEPTDKNDTETIEEIHLDISTDQSNQSDQDLTFFDRKRKRDEGIYEHNSFQQNIEVLRMDDEEKYDEQFLVSLLPFMRRLDPIRKLMVRSKIQASVVEELSHCSRDPIAH